MNTMFKYFENEKGDFTIALLKETATAFDEKVLCNAKDPHSAEFVSSACNIFQNLVYQFEFTSKQDWVNRAQMYFRGIRHENHICFNVAGQVLETGADFSATEENNLYPVKVYTFRLAKNCK